MMKRIAILAMLICATTATAQTRMTATQAGSNLLWVGSGSTNDMTSGPYGIVVRTNDARNLYFQGTNIFQFAYRGSTNVISSNTEYVTHAHMTNYVAQAVTNGAGGSTNGLAAVVYVDAKVQGLHDSMSYGTNSGQFVAGLVSNAMAVGEEAGNDGAGRQFSAFGFSAGQDAVGDSWLAVGQSSGQQADHGGTPESNITGDRWSAVGFAAGYEGTGSNSAYYGIYAGRSARGNNRLYIDAYSNDPGYAAGDATNDMIYGDNGYLYLGRGPGAPGGMQGGTLRGEWKLNGTNLTDLAGGVSQATLDAATNAVRVTATNQAHTMLTYTPRNSGHPHGGQFDVTNWSQDSAIHPLDLSALTNGDGSAAVPVGVKRVDYYIYGQNTSASRGFYLLSASNFSHQCGGVVSQVANTPFVTEGAVTFIGTNRFCWYYADGNWTFLKIAIKGYAK